MPNAHDFLGLHSRRRAVNMLLRPALQLGLPLYLVGLALGFAALVVAHGWLAYSRLFTIVVESHVPPALTDLIKAQTQDFLYVSLLLVVAYVLVTLCVGIAYAHRMVGPMVAFRRHLESLKNGDYASRVTLRKRDAFGDVAADLNELAGMLETAVKKEEPSEARQSSSTSFRQT